MSSIQSSGSKHELLKKPVDTLAIVPQKDRLWPLARKVFNVLVNEAQKTGFKLGSYQMKMADLVGTLEFNSGNTEILKEHLRQMAQTTVEWQSPTKGEGKRWTISTLISHATLDDASHTIEWSFSKPLLDEILEPSRFAKISLQYQAQLKSYAGLVLYEICCRYIDNQGGLTARQPWAWWRPVLTGVPETAGYEGAYIEWKYFSRSVVKTAVAEVNAVTDFNVQSIEHRKGRAVVDLQFKVTKKGASKLPGAGIKGVPGLALVGRLIKVGIHQEKAERLLERFGDKKMLDALCELESRLSKTTLEPVRDSHAFIKKLLEVAHEESLFDEENRTPSKPIEGETKALQLKLLENFRAMRRAEALSLFNELPKGEQNDLLNEFEMRVISKSNSVTQKTFRDKGLNSPIVKAVLVKFLSENSWGPAWDSPTDSELLNFSLQQGKNL